MRQIINLFLQHVVLKHLLFSSSDMIIWCLSSTVNFSSSVNLRIRKQNTSCIAVTWQKKDAGLCQVNYHIQLKNKFGVTLFLLSGRNIARSLKCDIPSDAKVTRAVLTITSLKRRKSFIAEFQQELTSPPPSYFGQRELSNIYFVYFR